MERLFEPRKIGTCEVKNSIAMAPMGLVAYSDLSGGFNENAQEYYITRAKGGTGLIITGICSVDYNEIPEYGLPCPTYNPLTFNMSTAPMNEKIHAYGSKIFLQLTGGLGRSAMPGLFKKPIAPSESQNRFDPRVTHQAMTIEEIQELVSNFVKAAVVAKRSGFDGVEIHAVHEGYLLDQFALAFFNKRTDEYGGDLDGRLKISTDIVRGIKKACGEDFPVSLRFSVKSFMKGLRQGALPGEDFTEVGKDVEEGIESAKKLVAAGYDALNVDVGTYDSWFWNHPPMYFNSKGIYLEFGKLVKEAVDVPVILAGRMDDQEIIKQAFDQDACDLVSFGRPLLADPYLPEKIRKSQWDDIRPCLSCHDGCMGRIAHGLPLSCAVNPQCGREASYGLKAAERKKRVLVIGGGPAGMEAARVCKLRGHSVTLMEKNSRLGGTLIQGSIPDFKSDDRTLIRWYEHQLENLGVDVKLQTEAKAEQFDQDDLDVIIMASGSKPKELAIHSELPVITAGEVLEDLKAAGEKIVVVGGGLVGCETALWLKEQGKEISIVEMMPVICGGPHAMPFMNWDMLNVLLRQKGVGLYTSTKIKEISSSGVLIIKDDTESLIECDTIVSATGYEAYRPLKSAFDSCSKETYNIGDSRTVGNIMQAVWDGYEIARSI